MNKNTNTNNTVLQLSDATREFTAILTPDADMPEVADAFIGLCISFGYSPKTVKNVLQGIEI